MLLLIHFLLENGASGGAPTPTLIDMDWIPATYGASARLSVLLFHFASSCFSNAIWNHWNSGSAADTPWNEYRQDRDPNEEEERRTVSPALRFCTKEEQQAKETSWGGAINQGLDFDSIPPAAAAAALGSSVLLSPSRPSSLSLSFLTTIFW